MRVVDCLPLPPTPASIALPGAGAGCGHAADVADGVGEEDEVHLVGKVVYSSSVSPRSCSRGRRAHAPRRELDAGLEEVGEEHAVLPEDLVRRRRRLAEVRVMSSHASCSNHSWSATLMRRS